MKLIHFLIPFIITTALYSQNLRYNTSNGYVANGYDVVAYFSNEARKGKDVYTFVYDNVSFKFLNDKNLRSFKTNPEKFIPQYGGWCAYAIALKNKPVSINPKIYEIRNSKLYLFYNKNFVNTHKKWLSKEPKDLIIAGDKNWKKLKESLVQN